MGVGVFNAIRLLTVDIWAHEIPKMQENMDRNIRTILIGI
jgi:hypothetical protein